MRALWLLVLLLGTSTPVNASIYYKEWTKHLNQTVHYIEVNPKDYFVVLAKAKEIGNELETVQSMQNRYGSLAGINGGFFKANGSPSGALKISGKWFTGTNEARSAIAWNTHSPGFHFGRFNVAFSLKTQNQNIPIDALNSSIGETQIIAYTPVYLPSTLSNPSVKEIVLKEGKILEIREGGKQALIPNDSIVIAFGKAKANLVDHLKVGDQAEFVEAYESEEWSSYENILGSTPLLLENGRILENMADENVHNTFLELRHPRSAVGVKNDGTIIFAVVEGRKLGQSKGVTIKELAEYMQELGCAFALNLDGGSSSTLVLQNKEIKGAYGNASELVSNALLILPK